MKSDLGVLYMHVLAFNISMTVGQVAQANKKPISDSILMTYIGLSVWS